MNATPQFFQRLLRVHLLFWTASFNFFDAVPLFATIVAGVGLNDILHANAINGVKLTILLQFILYVLAFIFCYIWKSFRTNMLKIANNMICLSLSVSLVALLLVIVMDIFTNVPPLKHTIGEGIRQLSSDLRTLPWDSEYSLGLALFLFSYGLLFINTLYVQPRGDVWLAVRSVMIIPLLFSFVISLLASFIVVWPVFSAMDL